MRFGFDIDTDKATIALRIRTNRAVHTLEGEVNSSEHLSCTLSAITEQLLSNMPAEDYPEMAELFTALRDAFPIDIHYFPHRGISR